MEAGEFGVFLYCHLGHKPFHLPFLCLIPFLLFFCYCSFFVKQILLEYHFILLFPFIVFLKNFKPFVLVYLRIIISTLIQKNPVQINSNLFKQCIVTLLQCISIPCPFSVIKITPLYNIQPTYQHIFSFMKLSFKANRYMCSTHSGFMLMYGKTNTIL